MSYKSEEQMIEKKRRTRFDLFTLESHFGSDKGGWRFQAWQEINGGGVSAFVLSA